MAQTPLGNLGLNYEHTLGVDDWKNSYDANWVISDSVGGQAYVVDHTVTAEPGSPTVGDAYVLDDTQTGTNWGTDTGAVTNSIALFTDLPGQADSSPWLYLVPREGWSVYDRTNNVRLFFDGTNWTVRVLGPINKQTGGTYEPVLLDANGVLPINNTSHTLNIADNATVPYQIGTRLTIPNQDGANAITVTDDAAVSWATGSQNLVTAGIAAGAVAEIVKTAVDEWFVLRNGALPT